MRAGRIGAALLAASLSALCGSALYAEDPGQRATNPAPTAETASTAPDEASKTVLPYHDVQGVLGKEVRSSAGEAAAQVTDLEILNFALNFERLQATFYTQAEQIGTIAKMPAHKQTWARTLGGSLSVASGLSRSSRSLTMPWATSIRKPATPRSNQKR